MPPEHYKVGPDALSSKEKKLRKQQRFGKEVRSGEKTILNGPTKLCLTFIEKQNYVISLDFLTHLTTLGVKVTK